jgi:hypothetical protein
VTATAPPPGASRSRTGRPRTCSSIPGEELGGGGWACNRATKRPRSRPSHRHVLVAPPRGGGGRRSLLLAAAPAAPSPPSGLRQLGCVAALDCRLDGGVESWSELLLRLACDEVKPGGGGVRRLRPRRDLLGAAAASSLSRSRNAHAHTHLSEDCTEAHVMPILPLPVRERNGDAKTQPSVFSAPGSNSH